MMKISTRARYGFKFMIHLSRNYKKRLVQIREVSKAEDISTKYLEQIAMAFKTSGLVTVYRGAKGGYELSRPPEEMTLFDIMRASEGEVAVTDCVSAEGVCAKKSECGMNKLWSELNTHIVEYLKTRTLKDITPVAEGE